MNQSIIFNVLGASEKLAEEALVRCSLSGGGISFDSGFL